MCHHHGILETKLIGQFTLFSLPEKCQSSEVAAFGNRRPRFGIALGISLTIYCLKEATAFRCERARTSFRIKKMKKGNNSVLSFVGIEEQ